MGHAAIPMTTAEGRPLFMMSTEHHPEHGTMLGFWVYLMSDCLIFAMLFSMYAVLGDRYAAGPAPKDLFDLELVAVNTALLLLSSITDGFAMLELQRGRLKQMLGWLVVTALFGLGFVAIEVYEFHHLIEEGAGPSRSAFLTSFFSLVATHGLHVSFGILWLVVLMLQVSKRGIDTPMKRRFACHALFWHFLDIVWIGVFTFVYLMGVLR